MRLAAVVAVAAAVVAAAVVAAGPYPTALPAEQYWNTDLADLAVLADLALRIGLAALVDCPEHTCRLDCPVPRRALFGHGLRLHDLGLGLDLCLRGYLYS